MNEAPEFFNFCIMKLLNFQFVAQVKMVTSVNEAAVYALRPSIWMLTGEFLLAWLAAIFVN